MDERSLTAATVARRSNLSQAAIHQYITGRAMPRPKRYPDIAAALGVPLAQFESWTKGAVVVPSVLAVMNNTSTIDDTLAEIRGALLKMPPQRWPVVAEIVRQISRI